MKRISAAAALCFMTIGVSPGLADGKPSVEEIIKQVTAANSLCRGGSGDDKETLAWCDVRAALQVVLELRNWCYGKENQDAYQYQWHQCGPGSLHVKVPNWQ